MISHKSDVGGVRVDLRNADEVAAAHRDIIRTLGRKDADLRVQVQRMITGGRRSSRHDARSPVRTRPVRAGVFVEVMKDVAIRIHPLTDTAARGMLEGIKGFRCSPGRAATSVDLDFLEECLLRLSQLVGISTTTSPSWTSTR